MAQKKTFEGNMEELEKIIKDLESGEAPLDKCVELFENGVKLSGECIKMINDARQKITLLTEKGETDFASVKEDDE